MRRLTVGAAIGVLVAGCAYYNGLFNANRLAKEARRAEREGRTSEARSLWSRAAVKAESVATRYPKSKYRDDALVLQGLALAQIGACSQAVAALGVAADSSPDAAMRTRARLLMGECWLTLRQPDSARGAVTPVVEGGGPSDRAQALLLRGEAHLRLGADEAALADLTASGLPDAAFPRAVALARLGRADAAVALLEDAVARPYVESGWLEALDSLGARAPHRASGLVDRLIAAQRLGPGQRARLLLADAERLRTAGDTARAAPRFAAVADAVPDSAEGQVARVYRTIEATLAAQTVEAVDTLLDSLQAATGSGGAAVRAAGRFQSVLIRTEQALRETGTPLQLFLAAEDVRDSLRAPELASALFQEVERRHPASVVAPKALLALAWLHPGDADSLIARLETHYPESVYTLALRGVAGDRYRAVEDSLRRLGREAPQDRRTPAATRRVRD